MPHYIGLVPPDAISRYNDDNPKLVFVFMKVLPRILIHSMPDMNLVPTALRFTSYPLLRQIKSVSYDKNTSWIRSLFIIYASSSGATIELPSLPS